MKVYRSRSLNARLERQRRRGRRPRGLRLAIGLALAGACAAAAVISLQVVRQQWLPAMEARLAQLSWLRLQQVHLISSGILERRQLLQSAGLKEGMKLWEISPQQVIDNLSANPLVRHVTLERKFPNELLLKVEERSPRALLRCQSLLYQVDLDGTPYQRQSGDGDGLSLPHFALHPCSLSDPLLPARLREGMQLRATLEESALLRGAEIGELTFQASEGWTVQLRGGPRQIHWGPAEEGKKLLRLRRVLADLQKRSLVAAAIDLDFKNRTIVRLAGNPAVEAAAAH